MDDVIPLQPCGRCNTAINRICEECSSCFCQCDQSHGYHHVVFYEEIIGDFEKLLQKIKLISSNSYYEKMRMAKDMLHESIEIRDKTTRRIRIGSWNLKHVTHDLHNDQRLIAMSQIIIKCKLNIVALQEVSHMALLVLEDKLNQYDTEPYNWKAVQHDIDMPNISGMFLYKTSPEMNVNLTHSETKQSLYHRKPVSAKFIVHFSWTFTLLNFHLRPRPAYRAENDCEVAGLAQFTDPSINEGDLILLGDFNCIPNNPVLASHGYSNIFGLKEYTNTKLSETYDNIIIPHKLHPRCVGRGIYLTHLRNNFPKIIKITTLFQMQVLFLEFLIICQYGLTLSFLIRICIFFQFFDL